MAELHDKNIVHLDLKPDNILIKKRLVKISDFGLSKMITQGEEMDINYGCFPKKVMIPEILNSEPITE